MGFMEPHLRDVRSRNTEEHLFHVEACGSVHLLLQTRSRISGKILMISISDVENWQKITYLTGCWKAEITEEHELVDGAGLWIGQAGRAWSS